MAKVLIIEDDPMLLEQYAIYLRSPAGGSHAVEQAKSATKAVELIKRNSYDLVLLDIMLAYEPEDELNPDINDQEVDYGRKMGLYVYRTIRVLHTPPPILLVSVVDDYGVLSEFPDAIGHLSKYFKLDDLGTLVRNALQESTTR
jgi:CheY-like chemotaxis protein